VTAHADWLAPDWRIAGAGAFMTTRAGGVSRGPYAAMNVGSAVGDAPASVAINRARLAEAMQARPVFLRQVHGARVVRVGVADAAAGAAVHEADAAVTTEPGVGCVVQAADCLPVLLAAPHGRAVGAAHAGWRGLAAGVVEAAVDAVRSAAGCAPQELSAWLGACIGADAFEVGADVLVAFGVDPERSSAGADRFVAKGGGKWRADLAGLARDRLVAAGVVQVGGGIWCTVSDPARFFSYRRDGATGRMAAAVWIAAR
jgi:YfiH family protein